MMRCTLAILFLFFSPATTLAEGCGTLLATLDGSGGFKDSTCSDSLTTDGPTRHCRFDHTYRAVQAATQFEYLARLIPQCLPGATLRPKTPGVNHPDTHLERIFDVEGGQITVSLKDKSQLGKTLVFLQVTRRN